MTRKTVTWKANAEELDSFGARIAGQVGQG